MPDVALRPLNTSLIRATVDSHVFESVDADLLARRVFTEIDAMQTDLKPVIAARFVDALAAWSGEPGSAEDFDKAKRELIEAMSASLAAAYEREEPRRTVPPLPAITTTITPAPNDPRKWLLMWNVVSDDPIGTELIAEPARALESVEASEFERALLAFTIAPGDAAVAAIAAATIDAPIRPVPAAPNGPASGYAVFDITERAAVRAVVVRNAGYPAGFVYTVEKQTEMFEPSIDRSEEIVIRSPDEIAALAPSRVEVWYEWGDPLRRLPVVLVIEQFDAPLVRQAMSEWRNQTEAPPDGEFIFDVTAARLRLRRVVIR